VARYRNGVPDSVTVYNTPVSTNLEQLEVAVFVQDSWAIAPRLTLNPGFRFERHTGSLGQQSAAAGQFAPARTFEPRSDLIAWNSFVPRLAATSTSRAAAGRCSRRVPASTRSARGRS
jgi:hypothetical protein